jgi:(2Fe-2S) ferredoxin
LGAEESSAAIREAITESGLSDDVHTTKTLCNGRCKDGPIVIAQPDGIWFKKIAKENAASFVNKFLVMKAFRRINFCINTDRKKYGKIKNVPVTLCFPLGIFTIIAQQKCFAHECPTAVYTRYEIRCLLSVAVFFGGHGASKRINKRNRHD